MKALNAILFGMEFSKETAHHNVHWCIGAMIAGQVMATGPDAKKAGDGARRLYRIIKSHEVVHISSLTIGEQTSASWKLLIGRSFTRYNSQET